MQELTEFNMGKILKVSYAKCDCYDNITVK